MKFLVEYTAAEYWNDPDGDDFDPKAFPRKPFEIEADSLEEAELEAKKILDKRTSEGAKLVDLGTAQSYRHYRLTKVSPLS